jgi:hypothetical protein
MTGYTPESKRAILRDVIRLTRELGAVPVASALARSMVKVARERGLTYEEMLQLCDDVGAMLIKEQRSALH